MIIIIINWKFLTVIVCDYNTTQSGINKSIWYMHILSRNAHNIPQSISYAKQARIF